MALRANTKISRELFQNCSRLFASKPEVTHVNTQNQVQSLSTEAKENVVPNKSVTSIRYNVASDRSRPLFKLVIKRNDDVIPKEMIELQPSKLPAYRDAVQRKVENDSLIADQYKTLISNMNKRNECCPYPEPYHVGKSQRVATEEERGTTISVSQFYGPVNMEGAQKVLGKGYREYSTGPLSMPPMRMASSTSDKDKCKKPSKCKPKKCRRFEGKCPKMILHNCPCRERFDCENTPMKVKCTKRMAPYPSYSESCVEELEEDPSECVQCPWKRCSPVNPVSGGKKHYHTTTSFDPNAAGPSTSSSFNPFFFMEHDEMRADASKTPCKRPPGVCEEREKMIQRKKEEKDKCPPPAPKRKCPKQKKCSSVNGNSWTEACAIWASKMQGAVELDNPSKFDIVPMVDLMRDNKEDGNCGKFPFDKREADYEFKRIRRNPNKCPKCPPRGKFHKNIPACPNDRPCKCDAPFMVDPTDELFYQMSNKPVDKDCPTKREQKYPDVDKTIDPHYLPKPCCEQRKNKTKRRKNKKKTCQ